MSKFVTDKLSQGAFSIGNPSAQHRAGKESLRQIHASGEYLSQFFGLSSHKIIYHSGATEGSNLFIQGVIKQLLLQDRKVLFCYFTVDHPCISFQVPYLESLGCACLELQVNTDGEIDKQVLLKTIQQHRRKGDAVILNYTWVHNESGVVWDLKDAEFLKDQLDCIVHVDATQAVGKISDFRKPSAHLDAYTFSGHKFGALKGVGWSFINPELSLAPLMFGGGQQGGVRPGTYNHHGILSLQWALEDLQQHSSPEEVKKCKQGLEKILEKSSDIELIGMQARLRNFNTIFIIHKKLRSDELVMRFDLAGYQVGSGAACSTGLLKESRTLLAMGHTQYLRNTLRISLPFTLSAEQSAQLMSELSPLILQ